MRAARVVTAHVVLVAHGSRDPRSAATVRALTRSVAVARPDVTVHDAYLDFDAPHLGAVLAGLDDAPAIVVPLLLSAAYHAQTDIQAIVEVAREHGGQVEIADVLPAPRDGGFELTVAALRRRLREAGSGFDGLVLAAAGSRNMDALAHIDSIAAAVGRADGRRCVAGYASGSGRPIADAIDYVRATGARNVGVASFFLAPGRLYDRILTAGVASGGLAVAPPLGDAAEIVAIASRRIDHCLIGREALV